MSTDHARRIIAAALVRANGHDGNARRMLLRAVERDHQFLYDITQPYLEGLIMKALTDHKAEAAEDRNSLNSALTDLALPSREAGGEAKGKPKVEATRPSTRAEGEPPPTEASPKHVDALRAMINAYKHKQPSED